MEVAEGRNGKNRRLEGKGRVKNYRRGVESL